MWDTWYTTYNLFMKFFNDISRSLWLFIWHPILFIWQIQTLLQGTILIILEHNSTEVTYLKYQLEWINHYFEITENLPKVPKMLTIRVNSELQFLDEWLPWLLSYLWNLASSFPWSHTIKFFYGEIWRAFCTMVF